MWKVGSVSIHGSSHIKSEKENQDFVLLSELTGSHLAVVCDGAGFASNSATGARLLGEALLAALKDLPAIITERPHDNADAICDAVKGAIANLHLAIISGDIGGPDKKKAPVWRFIFPKWLKRPFHEREIDIRQEEPVDINEYAATLLICLVSENQAWFGHIGDGYLFGLNILEADPSQNSDAGDGSEESITNLEAPLSIQQSFYSLPENGEYDNETYFFSDQKWNEHFRHGSFAGDFNFLVLFSDGADKFLVERNKQDFVGIHAQKLWNASKSYGELAVSEILEKFYTPEKVHAVSNDDTTIAVLTK